MALTIAKVEGADTVWGNKRVKVRDITFDAAYPAGGESLTASDVGLTKIDFVLGEGVAVDSDGTGGANAVAVHYDFSTAKLQAFQSSVAVAGTDEPMDEVGAESLANFLCRLAFVGH